MGQFGNQPDFASIVETVASVGSDINFTSTPKAVFIGAVTQVTGNSLNVIPAGNTVYNKAITLTGGAGASGQATVTVASTTGLVAGMGVTVTSGTGAFTTGTTVSSITNATQFVVSANVATTLVGATIATTDKIVTTPVLLTGLQSGTFLPIMITGIVASGTTVPAASILLYR